MRRKGGWGGMLQQETPVPAKGQDPCTPDEEVPQLGWGAKQRLEEKA